MRSLCNCVVLYTFVVFSIATCHAEISPTVRVKQTSNDNNDYHSNSYYKQPRLNSGDLVNIQLYYECFCAGCRKFDTTQFKVVVEQLANYLNIVTYPYGKAETINVNGTYEFKCQHGPEECYGNKLHACTLNIVQNQTQALLYNSCMMDFTQTDFGSDDVAADKCGKSMNIDSEPIKVCAKSEIGTKLLKHYGDESKKANFNFLPHILVNGKKSNSSNFVKDVCAAFMDPPPPCGSILY